MSQANKFVYDYIYIVLERKGTKLGTRDMSTIRLYKLLQNIDYRSSLPSVRCNYANFVKLNDRFVFDVY